MTRRCPLADVSLRRVRAAIAQDSKAQCREARRQCKERLRKKREAESYVVPSAPAPPEKRVRVAGPNRRPPSSSSSGGGINISRVLSRPVRPPVAFGSVAIPGRMTAMEDRVSVRPGFARPAADSPLDFFAVFDGHGGSHVAALCTENMHVLLLEEVMRAGARAGLGPRLLTATRASFARMDALALSSCACGRISNPRCRCPRSGVESHIAGSTATVAVVGPSHLMVANCGDSRAVLSRGGTAIAMSMDHKPDRPDELARLEAAGGRVIYGNVARVDGVLAMSRAIGDKYFKPAVIADPEMSILNRHPQDECLIIASDGLWDVATNDMACNVARSCLMMENPTRRARAGAVENGSATGGASEEENPESRCSLAANLLARLALAKGSADNISVIVVDLRSE